MLLATASGSQSASGVYFDLNLNGIANVSLGRLNSDDAWLT